MFLKYRYEYDITSNNEVNLLEEGYLTRIHCQLFGKALESRPLMLGLLHICLFLPFSSPLLTGAHLHHALIPLVLHQLPVAAADPADLIQRNDYWLPDDVVPVNYNLSLLVNMKELTTEGKVKIRLEVKNATNQITLHVQQETLTVLQDKVEVYDSNKIRISEHKHAGCHKVFLVIRYLIFVLF